MPDTSASPAAQKSRSQIVVPLLGALIGAAATLIAAGISLRSASPVTIQNTVAILSPAVREAMNDSARAKGLEADLAQRTKERDDLQAEVVGLKAEVDRLRASLDGTSDNGKPNSPPPPPPCDADSPSRPIDWGTTAASVRSNQGQCFSFRCPPGGNIQGAWGTTYYTADSPICSAAVHAGKITAKDGGAVTIYIEDPRREFFGSRAHGVTTLPFTPHNATGDYPAFSFK